MMQEKARDLFVHMVRDCGEDITRMQASFEMYVNQYLVDYPDEKQLLVDAYKVGIPGKIRQHAGESDYAKYLAKLGPRLAEASRRSEEEGTWGVQTWAEALDRTADYVAPAEQGRFYPDASDVESDDPKQVIAGTAMTMIVATGGALGAGLAAILFPLVFMALGLSPHIYAADADGGNTIKNSKDQWIYFAVVFLTAAVIGGAGACGGWLLGRGAELPWGGFCVAFGTAMTMFFIISVIWVPFVPSIIWKPIALFASVFGTTYKTAARGGNY